MAVNFSNNYLANNYRIMPSISTIGNTSDVSPLSEQSGTQTPFGSMLAEALSGTVSTDAASKSSDLGLLTGESEDLHSILIAGEKADIMLNLTVQIRNKMVESYQEIMRMQI